MPKFLNGRNNKDPMLLRKKYFSVINNANYQDKIPLIGNLLRSVIVPTPVV